MNLVLNPESHDTDQGERVASTPENQFQVRSFVNLSRHLEWDSSLYYVGRLREGGNGPVPAYSRVDTRLGWRLGSSLEISVVGQNLLSPRHPEFHDAYEIHRTLMQRSALGRVTWRF
jgi:iron complex outermembrane receptor protein